MPILEDVSREARPALSPFRLCSSLAPDDAHLQPDISPTAELRVAGTAVGIAFHLDPAWKEQPNSLLALTCQNAVFVTSFSCCSLKVGRFQEQMRSAPHF